MPKKRELIGRLKTKHADPPPRTKPKGKSRRRKDGKMCGAKCKDGHACTSTILGPNGRCRMHGGTRKKGYKRKKKDTLPAKKASTVHGIYADVALLDDEYPVYPGIQGTIGTLDEELHIARITLRRVLKAQRNLEAVRADLANAAYDKDEFLRVAISHKLLTVEEIEEHSNRSYSDPNDDDNYFEIAKSKMVRKIQDYSKDIRKYTDLVRKLEQARKELLETEDWGEDFVRKLAEDLRRFAANADHITIGGEITMGKGSYPGVNPSYVTQ